MIVRVRSALLNSWLPTQIKKNESQFISVILSNISFPRSRERG